MIREGQMALSAFTALTVDVIYSGTSPYGHLFNTDTSLLRTVYLVPERPKSI